MLWLFFPLRAAVVAAGASAILLTFSITPGQTPAGSGAPTAVASSDELVGLWKAKRRFGPDSRGSLIIERAGNGYTADMMGFVVPVRVANGELSFDLPNHDGSFRGKRQASGTIHGFWTASTVNAATPVTLLPKGTNRWSGQVVPLDDEQTLYLLVTKQSDGSLSALLRNIERDFASQLGVRGLIRNENVVSLVGRRGAQTRDTVIVTASFDSAQRMITFDFPSRGGSYDFRPDPDPQSGFYPRGKSPGRYVYRVPLARDDGWATASVDAAGIDRAGIERAVQHLAEMSMDSVNAPQAHALLIVRGGKLVLEEYFHGYHRDKVHNTRSASKSVTATIIGAAMLAGAPLRLSTPVYQEMNGGAFPPQLEPRKRAMTLEHLMTMSSGYFCDDNNEAAPGNEDGMWDQEEEPDFYKFTLKLPMAFAPGEKAIYCSINPNLALGMVGRAAGESPMYLFDRLVAAPMGITHYVWALDRAGNPYGGGGMNFVARDFIKFGQLMLNGGTWGGHRILSADFVARASTPLMKIGDRDYGLLWWPQQFPYMNRTVRGYSMLGAGGQVVYVLPELDLVVATFGGSFSSRGWRYLTGDFINNFVLPAVRPR